MKTPSILVVDDEPNNFDVIETLLANQEYILHYASGGSEAIASLDTFDPDLILLDVMMPDINGIEVCRQIKSMKKWQVLPIIMVTALNSKEDLARCLEAGADDFIGKPVNGLELRARVQSMLRIRDQYHRIQSFSKVQRNTINFLNDNLNDLRGNIAYSLSHELNTPLNGLLGGLRLLIDDLDRLNDKQIHDLLDMSYKSAIRLEKLTKKFLNYLHLELELTSIGEKTDETKILDRLSSSNFIEDIAKNIAQQYQRENDLIYEVETTKLSVAANHLKWIATELIDNGFKFSKPNTPVTVRGECKDQTFYLCVIDQGRGMTEEQISKVEAFMQFERAKYEQQGMGLGLKIAQKATELYKGRFQITSIDQQGTTVYLTLPITN
jgi:two-component system, sensor histidine kinase and response regulator